MTPRELKTPVDPVQRAMWQALNQCSLYQVALRHMLIAWELQWTTAAGRELAPSDAPVTRRAVMRQLPQTLLTALVETVRGDMLARPAVAEAICTSRRLSRQTGGASRSLEPEQAAEVWLSGHQGAYRLSRRCLRCGHMTALVADPATTRDVDVRCAGCGWRATPVDPRTQRAVAVHVSQFAVTAQQLRAPV